MPPRIYRLFLQLHVRAVILLAPNLTEYIGNAQSSLVQLDRSFKKVFGKENMVSNVHALLHLSKDNIQFGPLDNCSCFPFESYLNKLKRRLRKHEKPLEQIMKRYGEKEGHLKTSTAGDCNAQSLIFMKKHSQGPLPSQARTEYFNYKEFHSIVLFAVVDGNYNFIYANVGFQGRISDGGILSATTFKKCLDEGRYYNESSISV